MAALTVEMLCRQSMESVALALLRSKTGGRPSFAMDCLELAEALVAIGRRHGDEGEDILLHGLDMLKRGGEGVARNVLATCFLSDGRLLEAIDLLDGKRAGRERAPRSLDFWEACVMKARGLGSGREGEKVRERVSREAAS